ncbi:hypothetical protein [Klebsiella pneumoniae ISC21]|nr:hypothetical protein [Klebsiella pneumoniae ISC21]
MINNLLIINKLFLILFVTKRSEEDRRVLRAHIATFSAKKMCAKR